MGKGQRGGQESAIDETERRLGPGTYGGADRAGQIYWGSPTGGGGGSAIPRDRSAPSGGKGGKDVNYDRVYEVYRHWTTKDPSEQDDRGAHHDMLMGPAENELLNWIIDTHGSDYKPAFEYRNAQKSGASVEELSKFAPEGYTGTPLTEQGLWERDWPGEPYPGPKGSSAHTAAVSRLQGSGGGRGQGVSGPGEGGVAQMSIDNYLDLMNRYGNIAETGGYDSKTLDAIRSRALSPVRAVYSDTNRAIDRSRSLQGGYAPGYAATRAKTAREQSQAVSDATTNVEGGIGQMVQRGKLAGLGGMSSLYGTTPGLGNMFGNQALQSTALSNQLGMGLLGARQGAQNLPGAWEQTMGRIGDIGGAIFPFLSDKDSKRNIKPVKKGILYKLKKLPISTWSYKDDPDGTIHIGPMAQDFHALFGGDDDKTIHPVDVAGVTLGAVKELAETYGT